MLCNRVWYIRVTGHMVTVTIVSDILLPESQLMGDGNLEVVRPVFLDTNIKVPDTHLSFAKLPSSVK